MRDGTAGGTNVSERVRLSWAKRRELHGPSGGNHGQGIPKYKPGGRTHGHRNTYARDGCRCVWCTEANRNYFSLLTRRVLSRRVALRMRGQILPDDFDDDTRLAEAVLRYHPPRAWTAT